ncbi:MAG: LysR family transcriptional regulator, partial [Parvularculaceae bacterium]|nr:LysR family transcriptional regulator [Parvularculaceae bacterium]
MSALDLNLLLVFDAVMAERNFRRAAENLGRTQPSISQAAARLRDVFGDPLFRKTPEGVD